MEIVYNLVAVAFATGVSLGVGSSTLAILNFFAAIRDGHIDETERNMMGIVYVVLRVAMGIILCTTIMKIAILSMATGSFSYTPHDVISWVVIAVLFANAWLMTKHIMPSTFGPALQAGSWYMLGFLVSLLTIDVTELL